VDAPGQKGERIVIDKTYSPGELLELERVARRLDGYDRPHTLAARVLRAFVREQEARGVKPVMAALPPKQPRKRAAEKSAS
jgi:hypothetical protein